jgi:hypothetical protein
MISEIDRSKVVLLSAFYGMDALKTNWYMKDGDVWLWKVNHDGRYQTESIDPADLDDRIQSYLTVDDTQRVPI